MKAISSISPLLFLVVAACLGPSTVSDAGEDAGLVECAPLDAGCSDAQACCAGGSCHLGQCACVSMEGAACGGSNPVCCSGLTCNASGHCEAPCSGSRGSCRPPNDACQADGDCCSPAKCVNQKCQLWAPRCADDGDPCMTDTDCCGDSALGSRPQCVNRGSGKICHFGRKGESCNSTSPCLPSFACVVDAGVVVDAGTPADAGAGSDAGSDAGLLDDGGVIDLDAGTSLDAGAPVDAGTPPEPNGVCGVIGSPGTCTLRASTCAVGAACNPNSSANAGYDPCGIRYDGQSLYYRSPAMVCHSGVCSLPQLFEPCTSACGVSPGVSKKPQCVQMDTNSTVCLEQCTTDADCPGVFFPSGDLTSSMAIGLVSPVPLSMWCVPHPEKGKSFCQPRLCYEDGSALDNVGALYKPCDGVPNSLCIPHETRGLSDYFGSTGSATTLAFCQAIRPASAPTVGLPCDVRAGSETPNALCGADATCVGGVCQKTCDASLPGPDFPTCSDSQSCVNPYLGTDPLSAHQSGVCGATCDMFADEANSGCVTWCGGPRAKCQWQGLDKIARAAHCEPMSANPKSAGQTCKASIECGAGMLCWTNVSGQAPVCTQLCNQLAAPGASGACKTGSCQPLYDGADKIGACQ